jgi:predicted RecB family nuclease
MCDVTGQTPNVYSYSQEQQDRAAESMKSWLAWRKHRTIEPIFTEKPFVSECYRYGGTLDLFARIDGVQTLVDFKSAKALYSEHGTQVVGYRQLLIENGYTPEANLIIRVGREPGEGFEERPVDRIDLRWELFQACLRIYNGQKVLK